MSKDIDEDYDKALILNSNLPPQAPDPQISTPLLTDEDIKKLEVKELKRELYMQGQLVSGKKEDLVAYLIAAVLTSVSVSYNVLAWHMSMTCLDVTSSWVVLIINQQ